MTPPAAGLALAAMAQVGTKLATSVRLAEAVKVWLSEVLTGEPFSVQLTKA